MKTLILILLLSINAHAQEWKEMYVTTNGDTIKIGTKIKLQEVNRYKSVRPSGYFIVTNNSIDRRKISAGRYTAYYNFLHMYLKSEVVTVSRLTRIPNDGAYSAFAVFTINDKNLSSYTAEYYIDIESALKDGEVKIISNR